MDIAIAGVAVRLDLAEDRTIAVARIVLAAVGPTPLRAASAEQLLRGNRPERALSVAAAVLPPTMRVRSPIRGLQPTIAHALVEVLTRRGVDACARALNLAGEMA